MWEQEVEDLLKNYVEAEELCHNLCHDCDWPMYWARNNLETIPIYGT